jgi:hypothetical protein
MTITVEVPDALLSDLAQTPEELGREIRRIVNANPADQL